MFICQSVVLLVLLSGLFLQCIIIEVLLLELCNFGAKSLCVIAIWGLTVCDSQRILCSRQLDEKLVCAAQNASQQEISVATNKRYKARRYSQGQEESESSQIQVALGVEFTSSERKFRVHANMLV